ncbi:MAG: NAD-dependent epimerase/dehydratase family protein [Actinobacteria bacterium]|nr:MAG: NAD-dependent epimerase/dehydratase family protein [Actinomycetota bacterium]
MRALVTGCAGFIGSHLTESLLADGHEVLGVDCFNDNYDRRRKLTNLAVARDFDGFEFVPVDLARGDLRELVDECGVVFHLAAEPGVRSSWGTRFETYLRNNVLATQCVLEAVRPTPDKRVVYASSSSVYGHAETLPTREDALPCPFSPYGVTKLAAEHLCRLYTGNHGVETVSLRFFTVYGPRQRPDMAFNRFCRAALRREPLTVFGDGEQTRDFTYVDDIVSAVRAAALAPAAAGGVYNVGGGSRVSVNDALRLLAGFAGGALDVRYVPTEHGDVRHTGADTSRARADLGYAPRHMFADGLRAEFDWMREADAAARRLGRASGAPMEATG